MIIADQKPFAQVKGFIEDYNKILILGCGTCVTVCLAGGDAEAKILGSGLRIALAKEGKKKTMLEDTVQRQCDLEFVEPVFDRIKDEGIDAIVTMACGVGVNYLADRVDIPVLPGVDTTFYGGSQGKGIWSELCAGCGDCITHVTGGLCPIARCSKHLLNGPCGGSEKGKCEVDPATIPCVWQLIHDRLTKLGKIDVMKAITPMKDWRPALDGGARRRVREDLLELDHKRA